MKVLVSSKSLYNVLSQIDFNTDSVRNVILNKFQLIINTYTQSVNVCIETRSQESTIIQENVRWDFIKSTVGKLDDQPIALDIHENVTNIILQY